VDSPVAEPGLTLAIVFVLENRTSFPVNYTSFKRRLNVVFFVYTEQLDILTVKFYRSACPGFVEGVG